MKKSYKVKIIPSVGEAQTLEIAASKLSATTTLSAIPGGHYQLLETASGQAPDNIRVSRKGKDLRIHFEGSEQADLVISNYYANSAADPQALIGQTSNGNYHPYIPESGNATTTVAQLNDGMTTIGMALGSEPLALTDFTAAGIGVAAAAGFNPLWAAPLLLLGAGGGAGAKSNLDTTPPPLKSAALFSADDTGVSATDGITGNNKPRITGVTEPNASVKVTLNGQDYVGQADDHGRYLIQVTNALPNTLQTYKVQATDAAGNSTTADGTPFTVDASNVSTSQGVGISIDAITQDTGVSQTDFITGDNTVVWRGALIENNTAKFNSEDRLQVQLVDAQSQIVATEYIQPTLSAGVWNWTWPGQVQSLSDGVYTLKTQLVDIAGNVLSATPWATTRTATVDTQAQQLNGVRDPNADFNVSISSLIQDTGLSTNDFVTKETLLSFAGKVTAPLNHSNFDVNTGLVLAELIDSSGKVKVFKYLTPSATGDWTFDNTAFSLGVADAVTTYTLKTATVDMAGHVMNATSQAFTVDLHTPNVSNPGVVIAAGGNDYSQMSFNADEQGVYLFNGVQKTGATLDLGGITHFEAGQFNVVFRDTAGNERAITNTQAWDFHLIQPIALTMDSTGPGGFGNGQLVGSVGPTNGKYEMASGQNLDLSTLYSLTPTQGSNGANGGINHIVMGAGAQTLTVSIGDVLQLGISNSFSNATAFKDHLQMRVDGDAADQLNLSKQWANSTEQGWVLNPLPLTLGSAGTYSVYANDTLKLDLFVQSAVHVSLI